MSLVARHLEENGIATVVVGSARDIVEECGVPRFLFSDFPLGNPCGRPYDTEMQNRIVGFALDLLESVVFPRTTVQTPIVWSEDETWKERYARIDPENAQKLRVMGKRAAPGSFERRRRGATAAVEDRSPGSRGVDRPGETQRTRGAPRVCCSGRPCLA